MSTRRRLPWKPCSNGDGLIASKAQILAMLDDERAEVRQGLRFAIAPASVWLEIIAGFPLHRRAVALNEALPDEALAALARDPDPLVRLYIAGKDRLPDVIRVALATDPDVLVRAQVARDPRTPRAAFERLRRDGSERVREAAQRGLENRARAAKEPPPDRIRNARS